MLRGGGPLISNNTSGALFFSPVDLLYGLGRLGDLGSIGLILEGAPVRNGCWGGTCHAHCRA